MRKGISYLVNLAKSRFGKIVVACAVVGLTMASAHADIVAYDSVTGITTWDFSTLLALFVGVCAAGIGAGATIFGIKRGWGLVKGFFRG